VASGKLREDLLYRLNVFPIHLPPLRERIDDLPLLAEHFLGAIGAQEGRTKRFSPDALTSLQGYPWPGNVRELRNVVQRAYVMAAGEVIEDLCLPPRGMEPDAAPSDVPAVPASADRAQAGTITLQVGTTMAQAERELILATFASFDRHKERTAAALGISLKTLYNRLKEYQAT
jgi:DNA-binding NtrC family response regulator